MRHADQLKLGAVTPIRIIPVLVAAAFGVVALERITDRPAAVPTPAIPHAAPARTAAPGGDASYDAAFEGYGSAIASARRRAAERPDEWLVQEQLARALLARGRLSGSYDDYAEAQAVLDRAFRNAPAGAGPHLAQATLHLLMHRLASAEQMLDAIDRYAVPPDRGEQAEIAGMRGDIAFYRGDYPAAWRLYGEADRLEPGSASFRRAIFNSKTGRTDLAAGQFESYRRSLSRPTRQLLANVELQRGILHLDTGRWAEALDHFRRADAIFPGWWLVEEHIAETTALLGDTNSAERMYRRVVERTRAPEFMDALAALLLARGAVDEADRLRTRSRALWEVRLRQFPEASYGHALDHCVAFGDLQCALRLARANHAARPYGEAGERLAELLTEAGEHAEARLVIDGVLQSHWRTPQLLATAAKVYEATGGAGAAEQFREQALRLNPRILD